MKTKAKITSKGQITVPREVRRALGVKEGDNLVFEENASGFSVRPVRNKSAFAKYRGIGNPGAASGREDVLRVTRELRGRESDK